MNQDINNKIKLISEMLSIYQNTVVKEKDLENLKLIKKDIDNKKNELEDIKKELNCELNSLYENGANEIDPEINQLQVVINEVNELLEEILPDVLSYIKIPNTQKDNVVQVKEMEETKNDLHEKSKELNDNQSSLLIENIEKKNNKPDNIEKKQKENNHLDNSKSIKKVDIDDKKIKNEIGINVDNRPIKAIKIETQKKEIIDSPKEIVNKVEEDKSLIKNNYLIEKNKKEIIFEEIPEEELYIAPRKAVAKEIIKPEISIQKSTQIIAEKKVEETIKEVTEKIKTDFDSLNDNKTKKAEYFNTITIKQPSDDYKNVASSIVSNRLKSFDSPENAIQKAHNAAESVMNSIIETWKNNNN